FISLIKRMISSIVIMLIVRIGSLLSVGFEKVLLLYNQATYETADVVSTFAARLGGIDGSSASSSIYRGIASASEMINNVTGMLLVIGANTISRKASDVSLY
ncbi:MAG: sugar ABC transporter permease, partial [Clostridia bacterium]